MEQATSLILIAGAAFLLPLVAGKLRLPAVVLEIAFGVVAGPSLAGLIRGSELLDFLAEFGFLLLMFLSGFEIDFGKLQRQGPARILSGLAVFGITLGLSYGAARLLGEGTFVMLLLATTSVGLVVPTLRSTRRSGTTLGQLILISALLADLLTLIGVTVFALIVEHGGGWKLLNLPILFGVIAAFLLALRRVTWWRPHWFERLFVSRDPEEMGIRTCLALMFIFVGLSLALDVEPILGAFLAGMVFALVFRNRGGLEEQLTGFSYGFLIPIFFINVGIRFDLSALSDPRVLSRSMMLIGAAVVVKLVAVVPLSLHALAPRGLLAAGVLLSARLSLVIAVADLGVRLGLLDTVMQTAVILLAVLTATLCPVLFRALAPPLPAAR